MLQRRHKHEHKDVFEDIDTKSTRHPLLNVQTFETNTNCTRWFKVSNSTCSR